MSQDRNIDQMGLKELQIAFKEIIEELNKTKEQKNRLRQRELEVHSLLELTTLININTSAKDLYEIYGFTLAAHKIVKIALIMESDQDENWDLVLESGFKDKLREQGVERLMPTLLSFRKSAKACEESLLKECGVEYILPVYHKEKALAFALIGTALDDAISKDEKKLHYLQTITNIIAVAIENKKLFKKQEKEAELRKEKELAAEIQQMLIPQSLPEIEHLEMQAKYLPHSEVGGDYYDIIEKGKHLFLCIGDISGKGTPAALLMSNVQANVRALISEERSLAQIVRSLNTRFVKITKGERFITFFIARLDLDSGELSYVNAGHNHPVLIKNGKLQHLDVGCTILGVFDDLPKIKEGKSIIAKDDCLFLYTDGLSDLENEAGEHFGEEQIDSILIKFQSYKLSSLLTKIERIIEKYRGAKAYYDDITYMAIKQTF